MWVKPTKLAFPKGHNQAFLLVRDLQLVVYVTYFITVCPLKLDAQTEMNRNKDIIR